MYKTALEQDNEEDDEAEKRMVRSENIVFE